MSTETVRETFYRCEVCGQRFKVLSEASAHEAVCRENEFRARSLIGKWVFYGTRAGFVFDAADNGSCVRLYVPLEALIHIAPADQCRVTDEETAIGDIRKALEDNIALTSLYKRMAPANAEIEGAVE